LHPEELDPSRLNLESLAARIRFHGRTERQTEDRSAAVAPALRAGPAITRSAIEDLAGSLYKRSLRKSSVSTVRLRTKAVQSGQRSRRSDLEDRPAGRLGALRIGARPSAVGSSIEVSIAALNHLIRPPSVRAVWQRAKVIQRSQLAPYFFVEKPCSVLPAIEDRTVDGPVGRLNRRCSLLAVSFWVEPVQHSQVPARGDPVKCAARVARERVQGGSIEVAIREPRQAVPP